MENWKIIANEMFKDEFRYFLNNRGRRPDSVEFTDIKTDAGRRDLTINALYYDIDKGEIIDFFGGIDDIKNGIVKTVGEPNDRFIEDKLRILRSIRFSGRFGSQLDPKIDAALKNDSSLEGISGERIRDEFIKGIKTSKSTKFFLGLIEKYNLFDWVFPKLNINGFIEDKDPIIVIATLLKNNDTRLLAKELNNLKYTFDEIKGIIFLINILQLTPETAVQLKRLQKNCGLADDVIKKFGISQAININLLDTFINFKLSVNGDELMKKLNMKPGKALGDEINTLEYINFKNML